MEIVRFPKYVCGLFYGVVAPLTGSLRLNISRPLLVEGTLVLQPLSVIRYARDLLSVVIWNWIRHGTGRWVDTELLHTVVELFLLLQCC